MGKTDHGGGCGSTGPRIDGLGKAVLNWEQRSGSVRKLAANQERLIRICRERGAKVLVDKQALGAAALGARRKMLKTFEVVGGNGHR